VPMDCQCKTYWVFQDSVQSLDPTVQVSVCTKIHGNSSLLVTRLTKFPSVLNRRCMHVTGSLQQKNTGSCKRSSIVHSRFATNTNLSKAIHTFNHPHGSRWWCSTNIGMHKLDHFTSDEGTAKGQRYMAQISYVPMERRPSRVVGDAAVLVVVPSPYLPSKNMYPYSHQGPITPLNLCETHYQQYANSQDTGKPPER